MNKTESAATDYLKYLESERDKLLQQRQQQPRPTQRSTTTDSNLNTTVYKWNPKGTAPSTGCGLYCLLVPGCVQDRHGFLSEVGEKKNVDSIFKMIQWYKKATTTEIMCTQCSRKRTTPKQQTPSPGMNELSPESTTFTFITCDPGLRGNSSTKALT